VLALGGCHKPPAVDGTAAVEQGDAMVDYLGALQWLAGVWSATEGAERVSEEWLWVHPRLMLGSNRTVSDGALSNYEHLEIRARGGDLIYRAKPKDQPAVEFTLVELAEDRAVFENPDHDFPQRIVYRRTGEELSVSISGEVEGEAAERSWKWRREPPAGPTGYVLKSVVVDAPAEAVYEAFTDVEQVRTFFAPDAKIELREGGAYEMYFIPDAPQGSRGGEGCTIVELEPPSAIAFTWNFPPEMPTLRDAHTLVTIRVSSFEEGRARVDLKQEGFRSGADWDEGREYFERSWGVVLDRLQKRFVSGPIDLQG